MGGILVVVRVLVFSFGIGAVVFFKELGWVFR